MKATKYISTLFCVMICALILKPTEAFAQSKFKARISVDYAQIAGEAGYLKINAKYRDEEKQYHPANYLTFNVYKEVAEDSLVLVGETKTNADGNAKYVIPDFPTEFLDTVLEQTYVVKIEGSERFKKAKKNVSFQYCFLTAKVVEEDSTHYIQAQLLDAMGRPIEDEKLSIQVQRLYGPLAIGESYYKTDETGEILVELEEDIHSRTGEITFEVLLDSRDLGMVKSQFDSNIGIPSEDLSTYNERKMWSPPSQTPIFLLVFANALIFGIWIVIFIVVFNLIKIKKSL